MPRLVTYGAACSLDGFIARSDGGIDWLHFSPDVQEIMRRDWGGIDTVLMGRRTWEVAAAKGALPPSGPMACYVFSRTLEPGSVKGAELVSGDAGQFVRRLKEEAGKNVCVMGGGDFARSLFSAGVIDEVRINVHPVLLGSGVPLFRDSGGQIDLELTECRPIDGGCVLLRYRARSTQRGRRKGTKKRG